MTFRDVTAPIRSIPVAIFAGLALLLAGALSILSVSLFGRTAGFGFLPLIVLALWPRRASEIASLIAIFVAGLFTDWATGNVTGQSTLLFTFVWMLFRPELREEPYAIFRLLIIWLLICISATLLMAASGWFVYRIRPDMMAFLLQFGVATTLLPICLLLRRWLAYRFGNEDEWGR